MEKRKPGRPKTGRELRERSITFKITKTELDRLKNVCLENHVRYVDVLMTGLDQWEKKL